MLGLMHQQSLLISSLLTFTARHHGDAGIVSRRVEGDLYRHTWADAARRAGQVGHALDALQLAFGADDVVFVDTIPLGAAGKMLKTRLREQLKDYALPSVA